MDSMTTAERFSAVMKFQPYDRLPIVEWAGWWNKTIERWHSESLPAEVTDRYAICEYFGLDVYLQDWMPPRGADCPKAASHGAPLIESMADYEKLLPHLYPWPAVDREKWSAWGERRDAGSVALWFSLDGFFWFPRTLLGIEPHLYAFYDQPELMHRINRDLAGTMSTC